MLFRQENDEEIRNEVETESLLTGCLEQVEKMVRMTKTESEGFI